MSDAPERIWAWVYADPYGNELRWFEWENYAPEPGDIEYVRADRIAAQIADLTRQLAEARNAAASYQAELVDAGIDGSKGAEDQ